MIKSISKPGTTIRQAALASLFLLFPVFAWAQSRTETIAQTGQAAPDGNGTLLGFGSPVLNDSGQVAFWAGLIGTSGGETDDRGIFRSSGGSITQIAREGQTAPDANGTYSFLISNPVLNNSGQAAFWARLTGTSGGGADDTGIFRGSGGSITQIARAGQAASDANGTYSSFSTPVLNESGQAAFRADLTGTSGGSADDSGIFRGSGGSITQIARAGQAAPDANGTYSSFSTALALNDSGQAAFFANLTGTSGGNGNTGIFRGSGGSITQIARAGQAAPDGNGTYSFFNNPALNNAGQAAFRADLTATSGGSSDNSGIFRGSGGSITQIAREGQAAPDANGTYFNFGNPVLNNSGQAVFFAELTGTSGGISDNTGIFRGSGGSITQIAREGQAAPDANGTYSILGIPVLNDSGQAVFRADLTGTSGGSADDHGIFTGDGIDLFQVARKGDALGGSTIISLSMASSGSLNEFGQIAYSAVLANNSRVVSRWTPDLHWRSTFSSTWDTASRWTLSLKPGDPHDVFIDPAASLTVTGPAANTTVRSLRIGGGTGLATLSLRNGATLTATNGVTIVDKGTLAGDGVIAGNVVNNMGGTINATNLTINGTVTNFGVVRGSGSISATEFYNEVGGRIRALSGASMNFSGTNFSNFGLMEIHDSELQVGPQISNRSGGTSLISLRNGSLIADAGINNEGSIAMTLGDSIVQGDIENSGIIQVSGGAHATFFGDVLQNGTMQVSSIGNTTSTAVLLGSFSGGGGFVGGGDVFALGDLRPGNSPGSVLYDGNLFLGSSTDTFIELGGSEVGDFDQLLVSGELNLAGDLFVSLINSYSLGAGQSWLIGDIGGNLSGQFNGLGEGDLVGNFGGRELFITYSAGGGGNIALFTAVPEPSTTGLLAIVLVGGLLNRRRRR